MPPRLNLERHSPCAMDPPLILRCFLVRDAAFESEVQGDDAMAKPYETLEQVAFQKQPMVQELMAELEEIDERLKFEVRFYRLTD